MAPPTTAHTSSAFPLDDYNVVKITREGFRTSTTTNVAVNPKIMQLELDLAQIELGHYEHYMLKEIFEQPRALGDTTGFVKFLADATTDEILGVHIVGPQASELISEAVVAMEFKASSEDIARICHAHPSLSEATKEAALAVDKRTLNF